VQAPLGARAHMHDSFSVPPPGNPSHLVWRRKVRGNWNFPRRKLNREKKRGGSCTGFLPSIFRESWVT
jgi:hypothetical protein